MSVHAARALIGWRMSSGSRHIIVTYVSLWKAVRTMSLSFFYGSQCTRGRKIAVLRRHHSVNLQSAVEATEDHCKTVCFN